MLWSIFTTFFRIGLFTVGGGYAVLPAIQKELTDRCWLSEEECLDAIALVNGLPGPLVVNGSVFMGYRMKGIPGAIAAAAGAILPSILVILIITAFLSDYWDRPTVQNFFAGTRPGVCALLTYSLVRVGRLAGLKQARNVLLALGSLVAVRFMDWPYALIVLAAAVLGLLFERVESKKMEGGRP